jgi:hypothetical protein
MRKIRAILVFAALSAVAAFGQDRTVWRTSADVQEGARGSATGTVSDTDAGRNRLILTPDDSQNDRIVIDTDSVSTQYNGFGGVINGSPEVFIGSSGFNNVRVGDRVEVRGMATGGEVVRAERVTLLGRPVDAPQTGVGQTRTPMSISTPTASGTTPSGTAPNSAGRIEGVLQQINAEAGRLVIVTDQREVMTVRTPQGTPVRYHGDTYRISNLEVGDRIRVESQGGVTANGTEIRARSIEVMQSAQESGAAPTGVGGVSGRVMRVDRSANVIQVDTGRGTTIAVDLRNASDPAGKPMRARDVQAGDHVELSGSYSGGTFLASTLRFMDDNGSQAEPGPSIPPPSTGDLGVVTIYGTVSQTLVDGPQLVLRDTQNGNRPIRVYALEDLPVRTRAGTYTTATQVRLNDSLVIKAYRDGEGNYIAQTIRIR